MGTRKEYHKKRCRRLQRSLHRWNNNCAAQGSQETIQKPSRKGRISTVQINTLLETLKWLMFPKEKRNAKKPDVIWK